jgi:hypothetical protein
MALPALASMAQSPGPSVTGKPEHDPTEAAPRAQQHRGYIGREKSLYYAFKFRLISCQPRLGTRPGGPGLGNSKLLLATASIWNPDEVYSRYIPCIFHV